MTAGQADGLSRGGTTGCVAQSGHGRSRERAAGDGVEVGQREVGQKGGHQRPTDEAAEEARATFAAEAGLPALRRAGLGQLSHVASLERMVNIILSLNM